MTKMIHTGAAALSLLLLAACGNGTAPLASAPAAPAQASPSAPHTVADYYGAVQHIYLAYFGRPADPAGLDFFAGRLLALNAPTDIIDIANLYAANADIKALVDVFGLSQESKDLYPGDNGSFVDAVYSNLFGRAPDAAGRTFWVNALNAGAVTRGSAAVTIMAGARTTDADLVTVKSTVASNFTTAVNLPSEARAYSGLAANAQVRTLLGTVTLGTNLTTFQTNINSALSTLVASLPAEGLFSGTLAGNASFPFQLMVLDDGQAWAFHGSSKLTQFIMTGALQGASTSNNGNLSSAVFKDFGATPALTDTLSATYVPATSVNGSIATSTGPVSFATTAVSTAVYNYDADPVLADMVGNWPTAGGYALTISANGSFSAVATSCNFTGTLATRATKKNLFNASATFTAGSSGTCSLAGQSTSGIAYTFLLNDGATREVLLSLNNAAGTAGATFTSANVTPNGQVPALVVTDTVVGTGATATSGKTVSVHYTGYLYSALAPNNRSSKFDSSVDRGTPFSFTLGAGQVIKGWDQGVAGMKVGGKRTLVIPASLGYGATGTGDGSILPNASLVFDVEMLSTN